MKKSFFVLVGIVVFIASNAQAYESHPVRGDNYSYQFDVYSPGESLDYVEELVSSFEFTHENLMPFYSAAKKWADIINFKTNKPIEYAIISKNEYNASAVSMPVLTSEFTNHYISAINAAINNLNVIKSFVDKPNGVVILGPSISEEHPDWATFTGFHSLYHGEIPDLKCCNTP